MEKLFLTLNRRISRRLVPSWGKRPAKLRKIPEITDRQSETCCQSVDKKPAVKSNFQRLQEAKQRNAQVVAAYKSAQNSVSFNQQQITDLRAKLDKETGRLNNERPEMANSNAVLSN